MENLNDLVHPRVLWPPYKWRFCCSVTCILEFLPFMVCKSNSRRMGFRSLIVSAEGSSKDSGSALLDLCLWELCFSLFYPLLDLALGNASGWGGTLLVPPSLFFILLSLPLLSSPSPSFPFFFHVSFFPVPFLPHKLFPSLFFFSSFSPLSFPSPSLHSLFLLLFF